MPVADPEQSVIRRQSRRSRDPGDDRERL